MRRIAAVAGIALLIAAVSIPRPGGGPVAQAPVPEPVGGGAADDRMRAADAQPTARPTIAPPAKPFQYGNLTQAVLDAHADAKALPAGVREATRYLTIYNLPPDYRPDFLLALKYLTNAVSRESRFASPRRVCDDLYAIVLLDYDRTGRWLQVWERLADVDPYFHEHPELPAKPKEKSGLRDSSADRSLKTPRTKTASIHARWLPPEIAELAALTRSNAPIVRADWWLVQASRQLDLNDRDDTGVGYYDWLGLEKLADFEALADIDEAKSRKLNRDMRAALARSGIAIHNRQIERDQGRTGAHWRTLDSKSNVGRNNAIRLLARGDYLHDAEERLAILPNGLIFGFLNSYPGKERQNSAPDFVGQDDSPLRAGKDMRVHIGKSCIGCHVEGFRPIDDWVRRVMVAPIGLQTPDYSRFLELQTQYFSDLQDQLSEDNRLYAKALKACNDLPPEQNAKVLVGAWNRYALRDRGPAEIAVELGVSREHLMAALKARAKAPAVTTVAVNGQPVVVIGPLDILLMGLLKDPPEAIRPEHWEEVFPLAQDVVRSWQP